MSRRLAIVLALALPYAAFAQPNRVVYQGFLTDSGGDPVTDTVDLFFKLYPTDTGGAAVWSQTVGGVDIVAGSFAVELTMAAADLTQDDLWIGMAVGSAAEELPRMRVGSVPFALRGGDATRLGPLAGGAYQTRVSGSCGAESAITAINLDGTVDCQPDDAAGVTSVAGGLGLVDLGTTGNVNLDVANGDGLQVVGDVLSVVFGGSGLANTVARSDHDHPGQFVPAGMATSCFGGDKVTAIDGAGDVMCAPDANTQYSATGGVEMQPDVSGTYDFVMDTTPDVVVGASIYADNYYVSPAAHGHVAVHPSDFRPVSSSYLDYLAPSLGPGTLQAPGLVQLVAPLPVPRGSTLETFGMYYEMPDPSDSLCCYLYWVDLTTGFPGGYVICGGPTAGGITPNMGGVFQPAFPDQNAYSAYCEMTDGGTIGDVRLWGYVLDYSYTEMGR